MPDDPIKIRDLKVQLVAIGKLKPSQFNARTHSKAQVSQIALSITTFGWTNPILTDDDLNIIAGQGRYEGAKQLKISKIPVIKLSDMTEAQKRAYAIADNQLPELAGWDEAALGLEFQEIIKLDSSLDLTTTGFEMGRIDVLIDQAEEGDHEDSEEDEADAQAEVDPERPIISQRGDVWTLGEHRLVCGDAREINDFRTLLSDTPADMVFTDVPYNLRISGHVGGRGAIQHDEFAMASGGETDAEYLELLRIWMTNLVDATRDGSMHFHCIDWRHVYDMLTAGREVYAEHKNICVWKKTNAGQGSLYRSQHELVLVFKNGTAPHINNIQLGRHGRSRSNVWEYAGANGFGEERQNLALHPTVKPVKMVEDAILDCSNRGDSILDGFCGSGTTLIAAERAGRRGFGLEIEPKYVDIALHRYRALTGVEPVRLWDGKTLRQLE